MKRMYLVPALFVFVSGAQNFAESVSVVAPATAVTVVDAQNGPVLPTCVFCEETDGYQDANGLWRSQVSTRHCTEGDEFCSECDEGSWYYQHQVPPPVGGTVLSGITDGTCSNGSWTFWDNYNPCSTSEECFPISAEELSLMETALLILIVNDDAAGLRAFLDVDVPGAKLSYNEGFIKVASCSGEQITNGLPVEGNLAAKLAQTGRN